MEKNNETARNERETLSVAHNGTGIMLVYTSATICIQYSGSPSTPSLPFPSHDYTALPQSPRTTAPPIHPNPDGNLKASKAASHSPRHLSPAAATL